MENIIDQLAKAHERMRSLKEQRKERREELNAECEREPSYSGFIADKQEAQENIKRIKDEVGERTGLKTDLKDLADDIAVEQDVIAGCIEQLIADGKFRSGEMLDIGDFTITPSVRVKLNPQMKLL